MWHCSIDAKGMPGLILFLPPICTLGLYEGCGHTTLSLGTEINKASLIKVYFWRNGNILSSKKKFHIGNRNKKNNNSLTVYHLDSIYILFICNSFDFYFQQQCWKIKEVYQWNKNTKEIINVRKKMRSNLW